MFSTIPQPTVTSELPLRSWLLPYDQRTLITPLDEATVRACLTAYFDRLNATPAPGLFSYAVRYEGALADDTLVLSGPIGRRRLRLDTRGVIRSAPGGTTLALTLRLTTQHLVFTLGQFAFLWVGALMIGFPVAPIGLLSIVLYLVTMLSFRYEAAQIVRHLLSTLGPQLQPGEPREMVFDGIDWRCPACGGYVSQEATRCQRCKQFLTR